MLERMIGYFNAWSISIRSMKSVAKTPRRSKVNKGLLTIVVPLIRPY